MGPMATPISERRPPADRAVSHLPDQAFDALIVVSFGGPEGPDDVMPFLENVTRGRGIPPERLAEVAHHYDLFGGVSPINAQNRALIAAVERELAASGIECAVNARWTPGRRSSGTRSSASATRAAFASRKPGWL